ncbi:SDR family NAD(P)-dependent oxidoreductase [Arthrobacter globiformis]|uniref:SDR family NAD(P)-dependent oxidoreductase n=1 Tax=Arthrobacter globiformis TaxID=1665 RepID=UPI0027D7F137|nr:SDR family NAD(P)-dependent oxidoreductase [Arthrobacter globiformis]
MRTPTAASTPRARSTRCGARTSPRSRQWTPTSHPRGVTQERPALPDTLGGAGRSCIRFAVYAGARRVDRMEPLKAQGIRVLPLDVTDDGSMQSLLITVLREQGRIDVLVNNAGFGSFGALEEMELAEGRRQFDVNAFGMARMTQLVLPSMRTAGRGRIINISSIGGKFYEPLGTWYHASKFAVEGLSDALRLELKPHGISVSIIEPASTVTEWGGIAAEGLLASSGGGPYAA